MKEYRAPYQFPDVFRQMIVAKMIFYAAAKQFPGIAAVKYTEAFINITDTFEIKEGVSDISYI